MFTIVGLGNPGADYTDTRHNVGWIVLSRIIQKYGLPEPHVSGSLNGEVSEGMLHGFDTRVLFPHTFMNRSGGAVKKCLGKEGDIGRLIVAHDDIDLPVGALRISFGRGAGGHNGVRDIIDSLGTQDFIRVRIGIAQTGLFGIRRRPQGEALSRFVLNPFTKREAEKLEEVTEKADNALMLILKEGISKAMQEINGE